MPPVLAAKTEPPRKAPAAPPKALPAARSQSAARQAHIESELRRKMKAASPFTPDWAIRATVIGKSEELRADAERQGDGAVNRSPGRNDIYEAERNARWGYQLVAEIGAWIAKAKEYWDIFMGPGGQDGAIDGLNRDTGRNLALNGKGIPDRNQTTSLIYIEADGRITDNGARLARRRAEFRAKITAAGAAGAALYFRQQAALSGSRWWHANEAKTPNSDRIQDLTPPFRDNVQRFYDALTAAGAHVNISSTLRHPGRAYLMHYCWRIANGTVRPEDVPAYPGIEITWDHGDLQESRRAAREMRDLFVMAHYAALTSIHIQGRAIDMSITWTGTINIVDAAGESHSLGAPRSGVDNRQLHKVGASYGVRKLLDDEPHWSATGG